jgi:serine/threonine-protein kinase
MTATRAGTRLGGRYRLTERLAFGGMGEVWSGLDEVLGRAVAVKILRPELARDDAFRRRFREEARTAGGLSHPGIAAVYDYGEGPPSPPDGVARADGGHPDQSGHRHHEPDWTSGDDIAYLVMELVPGKPLSAILAESGPLAPVRAFELVAQTARALHAAHQRGVVHRDVKPANLMVTPEGRVKVTDFGIARPQDHEPLTATGQVMGTAHYLAPELARGHLATALSDVYALGVVAYECVAGRRPFEGDNQVAVATAHLSEQPPALPAELPADVRRVVMTAMQKEPEYRFGTADAFAEVLDLVRFRLIADDPVPMWATRGPVPGAGTSTVRIPGGSPRPPGSGAGGFLSDVGTARGVDETGGAERPEGRTGGSDTAALPLGPPGVLPGHGEIDHRPPSGPRRTITVPLLVGLGVLIVAVGAVALAVNRINHDSRPPPTGSGTTATVVSPSTSTPVASYPPLTSTSSRVVYGDSSNRRHTPSYTPIRSRVPTATWTGSSPTSTRPTMTQPPSSSDSPPSPTSTSNPPGPSTP